MFKPRQPTEPTDPPSAEDLDELNRHRASLGLVPIDLSAGWTAEELASMAQGYEQEGERNPASIGRLRNALLV